MNDQERTHEVLDLIVANVFRKICWLGDRAKNFVTMALIAVVAIAGMLGQSATPATAATAPATAASTPSTASPKAAHTSRHQSRTTKQQEVLGRGSTGPNVATLQRALREVGYANLPVTGYFGGRTATAVRDLQRRHHAIVDGLVGPQTRSLVWPTLRQGSHGPAVRRLQTKLGRAGLPVSNDGRFGPHTANAVRKFQTRQGLTVDRVVGLQTWTKLQQTPHTNKPQSSAGSARSPKATPKPGGSSGRPANRWRANRAMAWAKERIGTPYVFGANGPRGYDCSSFTQGAYRHAGVTGMPRTAQAQRDWLAAGHGFQVAPNQAQPGDLIFTNTYLGPNQIGHVMMVANPSKGISLEQTKPRAGYYRYTRFAKHRIYEIWRVSPRKATTAADATRNVPPAATGLRLAIEREPSPQLVEFVKRYEGWSAHGYNDPAGFCTIGYGTLLHRSRCTPAERAMKISKQEATARLRSVLRRNMRTAARSGFPRARLTQSQYDAIADWTYNLGPNTGQPGIGLFKRLNENNHRAVPAELMKWDKATNPRNGRLETLPGLHLRRKADVRIWTNGKYTH